MTDYNPPTDLVGRLRFHADDEYPEVGRAMREAADEIERLRSVADAEMKLREGNFAEIESLRARVAELEADAMRGRFLCEHWQSMMKGKRLPQWISDNALRIGSVQKAVDSCMAYAGLTDRLAAMKEGSHE